MYPLKATLSAGIATLIIFVICYFYVDIPTAVYIHNHLMNSNIQKISTTYSNLFSPKHWDIFLILLLVVILFFRKSFPEFSKKSLFVFLSLLIAIITGSILKVLLGRYRPELYFSQSLYGFHFFSLQDSHHSTPSGHALAVCAVMFAGIKLFPRWTLLFLLIILGIFVARVFTLQHYVSDVFFGAYIGYLGVIWSQSLLNQINLEALTKQKMKA